MTVVYTTNTKIPNFSNGFNKQDLRGFKPNFNKADRIFLDNLTLDKFALDKSPQKCCVGYVENSVNN